MRTWDARSVLASESATNHSELAQHHAKRNAGTASREMDTSMFKMPGRHAEIMIPSIHPSAWEDKVKARSDSILKSLAPTGFAKRILRSFVPPHPSFQTLRLLCEKNCQEDFLVSILIIRASILSRSHWQVCISSLIVLSWSLCSSSDQSKHPSPALILEFLIDLDPCPCPRLISFPSRDYIQLAHRRNYARRVSSLMI